ncbi:hypothetical protein GOQ27_14425 [Clostridium sp. D2Q-11]|uniref:Uncharacterized protein n=1 Tax=Anaeromonas frigoriresistens TaxID=2683708 RepID=A0A942UZ44_9FIRM|nr:hypothetical protein [Anaeromonas frigoriresistens]MBS4539666.1 hypothetical protein [Anaeromonas frigoriresistens]
MKISRKERKKLREKYPKQVIKRALKASSSEKDLKTNLEMFLESYKRTSELNYNPYSGTQVNDTKGPCHQ